MQSKKCFVALDFIFYYVALDFIFYYLETWKFLAIIFWGISVANL